MNIMIVTNSKYLKPAYVMLYSLFVNHEHETMDIYLPYEDLTNEEITGLKSFAGKFSDKNLYPLYVGEEFKKKVTSRNGINVETYYRILGMKLLPEDLDRILYLDVDMIIKGTLKDLYDMDLSGVPFVACEDIFGIINGFHETNKRRLGIPAEYSYFNAGVMLYNLEYLRENHAAERMLESIYENYERYEYNDQDVMNELYYDKVVFAGWDEYNCPPIWCYLNKNSLSSGRVEFADYDEICRRVREPEQMLEMYQNITEQIYQSARVIHYLGDTKSWSSTRKESKLYDLFDKAYVEYEDEMKKKIKI